MSNAGASPPRRRGRPRGGSSEQTRRALLDAARRQFAENGFSSTSLGGIAAEVGIANSAVYHYFPDKIALYREVFEETATGIWGRMLDSVEGCSTMYEGVELLLRGRGGERQPNQSLFLSSMPTVAVLHEDLTPLLARRAELQRPVFLHLAALGVRNGELPGFDVETGAEFLRVAVMGWFFERFWHAVDPEVGIDAILTAIRAMSGGAVPKRRPAPSRRSA